MQVHAIGSSFSQFWNNPTILSTVVLWAYNVIKHAVDTLEIENDFFYISQILS